METMLLIKLAVALVIGVFAGFALYQPYRQDKNFDGWSFIAWAIILFVVAVVELFLWLFQLDTISGPINHCIATLPMQFWVAYLLWTGQAITTFLLAVRELNK